MAGLSLSIQLARSGRKVILFEKEHYPFHRVCGEYISMESWTFLEDLGLPLKDLNLPVISKLELSTPKGKSIKLDLPLGGFGFSRYTLDSLLAAIAIENGVTLMEGKKVTGILFMNNEFKIECSDRTQVRAPVTFGTFGKRSNLDIKWKRSFTLNPKSKLDNYVGIKYHVHASFPPDVISLHLFRGGYCGLVKIEGDKYNLSYLTTAAHLKSAGNIREFEETVLCRNPLLKKIIHSIDRNGSEPVSISQISFRQKNQVEDHVLFAGDSAGMIAPLCGNGMSMALHGSKIAFELIDKFFNKKISRAELESAYESAWKKNFSGRLAFGRILQKLSQNNIQISLLIGLGKQFPALMKYIVRKTHGAVF